MGAPRTLRRLAFGGTILAVILVPFALYGARMETWAATLRDGAHARVWVSVVIAALLAGDIALPVPSSIVGTAAGYLLGFAGGTAAVLVGMVVCCMVGYALGRVARPAARRLLGGGDAERLEVLSRRYGDWAMIVARPVPVLAEASVLVAGMGRMRFARFMLMTTLSNLGIAATYAAVGAYSATVNSFLLAFAGALALPLVAMALVRRRAPQPVTEIQDA